MHLIVGASNVGGTAYLGGPSASASTTRSALSRTKRDTTWACGTTGTWRTTKGAGSLRCDPARLRNQQAFEEGAPDSSRWRTSGSRRPTLAA